MSNVIKLAWKMVSKQKMISLITIMTVVLSICASISILTVFNSMDATAKALNEDLYGEFSHIEFNVDVAEKSFPIEKNDLTAEQYYGKRKISECTAMSVCAFAKSSSEKLIPFGYIDSYTAKLAHIKMKQGNMPQNDSEIAVEASVLYHMGLEEKIGQEIKFDIQTRDGAKTRTYILSGIVSNYSSLWVKSNQLSPTDQLLISCFVSKNETEKLSRLTGLKQTHFLLKADKNTFSSSEYAKGNIVLNTFADEIQSNDKTSLPYAIIVITLICSALVISCVLEYSLQKQRSRWASLRLIGMNKRKTILLLTIILAMMFFIALPFGIVFGVGFTKIMILLIEHITKVNYIFVVSYVQLLISCLFALIAVASAGIIPCYKIVKISPIENYNNLLESTVISKKKKSSYNKKITLPKLIKHSNQNFAKKLLPIFLIAMFIVLFNFFSVYMSAFSARYVKTTADGYYVADYDFQFTNGDPLTSGNKTLKDEDSLSSPLPKDDSVLLWNDSQRMGCSSNMLEIIKGNSAFAEVKAYKDVHTLKLILPKSEFSEYLDFRDGYTNDLTASSQDNYSSEIRKAFDYNDFDMLINTQINGYSIKELNDFKPYVIEGKINIEKIKSGEEVILMLPSYYLQSSKDGGVYVNFDSKAPLGTHLYQDSAFHAGDILSLTQLETEKPLKSGYINLNTAKEYLKRKDRQVKIGAIIHQKVGRFSTLISEPSPITLLTLNDSFDNIGFPCEYSRVHMYLNESTNYRAVESEVKSYASELSDMNYENRISEMENYRSNKFLIQFSSNIFIVFLAIISFIVLSTQNINKLLSNERKYALLRINGMTIQKLLKMFIIDNLRSCSLAVLLATIIGSVSIGFTFFGFPELLSAKTFIVLGISVAFAYVTSLLSVFSIIPVLNKKPIADILRDN